MGRMMADKKFVGIDPGQQTGFAVYSCAERRLIVCETLSFREVIMRLSNVAHYTPDNTAIIIEDCTQNRPRFRHKPGGGVQDRMSQNVGEVKAHTKLLIEWLTHLGYEVKRERPMSAKWDAKFFAQVTKWTERTSQHARDAGRLCWGVAAIGT